MQYMPKMCPCFGQTKNSYWPAKNPVSSQIPVRGDNYDVLKSQAVLSALPEFTLLAFKSSSHLSRWWEE